MSTEPLMLSNQPSFILCRPLLLLPSIFPSIRVFSWWAGVRLLFLMKSRLFTSGGQRIGASASATILPIALPRQEYWSGLPFPSPGDLHDPGIELESPTLASRFFSTEPPGQPPQHTYNPPNLVSGIANSLQPWLSTCKSALWGSSSLLNSKFDPPLLNTVGIQNIKYRFAYSKRIFLFDHVKNFGNDSTFNISNFNTAIFFF